jgi:hypothetical protein
MVWNFWTVSTTLEGVCEVQRIRTIKIAAEHLNNIFENVSLVLALVITAATTTRRNKKTKNKTNEYDT